MNQEYTSLKQLIEVYGPQMDTVNHFKLKDEVKEKKLEKAISTFAQGVDKESIIAFYDFSLTENGKSGMLFTTAGIYIKEMLEKPYYIKYSNLETIEIIHKPKKDCDNILKVTFIDQTIWEFSSVYVNKTPLYNLLNEIVNLKHLGHIGNNDKFLIIEDMDEEVKEKYLSLIVNFIKLTDEFNGVKINEIYSLMSRINTQTQTRRKIMFYKEHNINDTYELLNEIPGLVPKSSLEVLHLSLIKDILKISGKKYQDFNENQLKFIGMIASKYDIKEEKILFLQSAIELDEKFLSGNIDDKKYVKLMTDLGTKAAGLGIPIAALYLSGSVVGLSAAGITSGLAALGLGGILGLSSMVTGVGIVVMLGVATYSGLKWLGGKGQKDKENKREHLFAEAIKLNQKTISSLIEDINCLTSELLELISQNEIQGETISRLKKKLELFITAFNHSTNKENEIETALMIISKKEEEK